MTLGASLSGNQMDLLTFIAELVKALGWPVAVVIIVLVLRRPIAALIPLLQRLKYKDLELEFGRAVEEIKAEAVHELPPSTTHKALPTGTEERITKLAEISPRAAVLEAWRTVENLLMQIAQRRLPPDEGGKLIPYKTISLLERDETLSPGLGSLLRDLRGLRNQAAHAPDFALSLESALEYASLAERAVQQLSGLIDSA